MGGVQERGAGGVVPRFHDTTHFLAPVQLRLLFAVLIGALSATACICTDLNDPFRGAFQITPSSQQLYLIREVIDRTLFYGEFVPQPPAPVLSNYKKKRAQQRVASVAASSIPN